MIIMKQFRLWAIVTVALILLLIVSQFLSGSERVFAAAQPVDYPTNMHTAKGSSGYYSQQSSLTPNTVVNFASMGYDTSMIQSATLVSNDGTASAICDTTHCTFSNISGKAITVSANDVSQDAGTFDWWRNLAGGGHSYWWSFDLGGLNAGTYYTEPNPIGGCGSAPCPYPNGTYSFSASKGNQWKLNAADASYTDGTISLSSAYVNLTGASINNSGRVVSVSNVNTDASAMTVAFDAVVGPFNSGTGETPIGSNPPGYSWFYEFSANLTGTTYYYPFDWTLTITPKTGGSPTPSPTPTSTPASITGDFQIKPSYTINYRDSFTLHPLPFTIPNGCTYTDHYYKIERGGSFVYTSKVYSQTQDTSYSQSNYPWIIAVGSHNVSLMIEASCGDSGFIATKTLTVNGPSSNEPPDFKLGWVKPSDNKKPLSTVVAGTTLDLIYIDDPDVPTPTDPDGDNIYFDGFDFNSADTWTKTVPGKSGVSQYIDGYHNILMDTVGYHYVSASFHDQWGLSTTRSAMIEVVPPNPVPVCTAPTEVKENRTVSAGAINGNSSYSPLGRTIDHSKDVWSNLQTTYVNGTMSDVVITVTLVSVTDSAGLVSLAGSDCHITVHPDIPPIGKLGVPSFGVRGAAAHIQNQSYSTDGDVIVSASYKYKYDVANDGFANDSWQAFSGNVSGVDITPTKIGKYLFFVNSCEDYGRCGDNSAQTSSEITLDVVNKDGPVVSFNIEGENTQPTVVPAIKYNAGEILANWNLFQTNTNIAIGKSVGWTAGTSNQLVAGLGRNTQTPDYYNFNYEQSNQTQYRQFITPAQDFGLGPNGLSPFRSFASFGTFNTQPLLVPNQTDSTIWEPVTWNQGPPVFKTTDTHIYFGTGSASTAGGFSFYGMNKSKIGRYYGGTYCNGCYWPSYEHKYLDGSPYDFTITSKGLLNGNLGPKPKYKNATFYTLTAAYTRDYTKAYPWSMREYPNATILGYYVTGNIVYAKVRWEDPYGYYYYDDNGDAWPLGAYGYDIRSYNATTGQFLSSSLENGFAPFDFPLNGTTTTDGVEMTAQSIFPPQSIGNDLVLTVGYSYYNNLTIRQINPQGQIVKSVPLANTTWVDPTVSPASTCRDNIQKSFRGSDGEFYYISQQQCSYSDGSGNTYTVAVGAAIIKFNADISFAWKTTLSGRQTTYYGSFSYAVGDHADALPLMIENPTRNQVLVRSYSINGFGYNVFYESLDKSTGGATTSDNIGWTNATQPTINWDGSYGSGVHTIEGYSTSGNTVQNSAGATIGTINGLGGMLGMSGPYGETTNTIYASEYVGDGILMALFSSQQAGYEGHKFVPWLAIGTPSTDPAVGYPTRLGQFVSNFSVSDVELQFTLNMTKANMNTKKAGLSFRMQDPKNRYAAETNGSVVYLTKYVNGVPMVLGSANYPFLDNTDYAFTVSMLGNKIDLKLNGVPYLSVQDSTWLSGTIGPVTDKSYATFSNITKKAITPPQTAWYAGFALWESGSASATVKYDYISYTDSENDPASGTYRWFYTHTPKFLNNQGISALDNKTYSGSQTSFDKVGVYDITLSAKDDPNPAFLYPSMLFDLYRKLSNVFHSSIVVHRRPVIPNFTNTIQGDGTVTFTDDAYDPDRYNPSPLACSAPDVTGIDYCSNHGIIDRDYYFIDPNGNYTLGKPTRPSIPGSYTVYLQVTDEYGALSVPASTTFTTAVAIAARPPIATLAVPSGSFASPTMVGVNPTITWNQVDPDGYALLNYQVQIFDSAGTLVIDSGVVNQNQIDGSQSWNVPINLTLGAKYQVIVRVKDVYNWSAWSNLQWMQVNSEPVATMTVPNGTQAAPTLFNTLRPTLSWSQTDIDPGTTFQYFQIQITNEANNTMILDSGQYYQGTTSNTGTWTVNGDLPTGQKLRVRVRVFDGYTWSNYSAQTWLFINRAPTGNITYVTPIYQNDTPTFTVSVTDADGDPLLVNVASSFNGGAYTDIMSWSNVASGSTRSFTYGPLNAGTYSLRLSLDDSRGGTYTQTYTFTVLPLSITGQVLHTPEWESYRQKWNVMFPSKLRAANVFWAGEELVLSAVVTNTGTSTTKPTSVSATLVQTGDVANLSSGDFVNYSGAMLNTNFVHSLSNGTYTMRFTVQWNNGLIQTNDVPFIIDSNIFAVLVNQLRN